MGSTIGVIQGVLIGRISTVLQGVLIENNMWDHDKKHCRSFTAIQGFLVTGVPLIFTLCVPPPPQFPRDPTSPVVKSITFPVTPEREGRYYCTGGGVRSEPSSLEIVGKAYLCRNEKLQKHKIISVLFS